MREPHRSVSSETQPPYALAPRPGPGFSPPSRRNLTERVAGWSARHRKTAVFGWLLLVVVIFIAGQAIGSAQLPQYDAGQAGQAEHVLNQVAPAARSTVASTSACRSTRAAAGQRRPGSVR
jgi:hypothetical protein